MDWIRKHGWTRRLILAALFFIWADVSPATSQVAAQIQITAQIPTQGATADEFPAQEVTTQESTVQELTAQEQPQVSYPVRLIEFHSSAAQPAPAGPVRCEVLLELADGSLLAQTEDGQLWTLEKDAIVSSAPCDAPFTPLTSEQIYQQFQQELPEGFKAFKTRHYVLLYNTSEVYVRWVAELYEQIYRGFYNYWKSKGYRLSEPRFPLVAVVFSNRASYMGYAEREIGKSAEAMIGYYNMKTNRMIAYDMTGVDGVVPAGTRIASNIVVRQILMQPQAERTVATIIHEAVHQLAFNSGLQVRLADNPLWLSEGVAMFFETPDPNSPKGWGGTIGRINPHNMRLFVQYLPQRPADSLLTLISQDQRLRDAETSNQAYPESWALTYYLMLAKNKQFVAYMKELAEQPPLGETPQRERVAMFKRHFGEDLAELDRDFINFFRRR